MNFDYFDSQRKHLFEYYDGIMLIGVHTFLQQDYLLYAINLHDMSNVTYMLAPLEAEEIEHFKQTPKAFLQGKLNKKELYYYTCSFVEGEDANHVRHLTVTEAKEVFPTEEFCIRHEYEQAASWVL